MAIQFCLSIRVVIKLPLGQTSGMIASLLHLAGFDWPVPVHFTRSRRQQARGVRIPCRHVGGLLDLLVDTAGPLRSHRSAAESVRGKRTSRERLPGARHHATLRDGRAFRKPWTGYQVRSRIEAKVYCLKVFGERIAASDPDIHTPEPRSALPS